MARQSVLLVQLLLLLLLTILQSSGSALACSRVNVQHNGRMKQRAVCSSHKLEDVPSMQNERDVEDFLLSRNLIRNLHDNSFTGYVNITTLLLDGNLIEQISDGAFKPLKKLIKLDISNNYLNIRNNSFLRPLANLQVLHMGGSPGEVDLDKGFFEYQRDTLLELSLRHTVRLLIREGAFTGLHRLRLLDLQNCNLKTLANTGLMATDLDSTQLRLLNLANNPWNCDCRLRWLIRWHSKKYRERSGLNFSGTPKCAGPPADLATGYRGMEGVRLFGQATHESQFQCLPQVYRDSAASRTVHRVNQGDNVTLSCSFYSDPPGSVVWLYGSESANAVLPLQSRYHIWRSSGQVNFVASLTIVGATERDSRLYRCSAANGRGNASLVHRVTVDAIRSAAISRKLITVVSVGVIVVITCALMVGGVFFYHYTRAGASRRRQRDAKLQQHQPQLNQHQQHQQQQQRGYSQLLQSRENGFYAASEDQVEIDGNDRRQMKKQPRRPAHPEADYTLQLHRECPVHGGSGGGGGDSMPQLFPVCPVHGCSGNEPPTADGGVSVASATLPLAGSRPTPSVGSSAASAAAARPCPLHGDLYATIAKVSPSPAASASGTYVGASKVDDCILDRRQPLQQVPPRQQAQQLQQWLPVVACPAAGPGHKPHPQDDEGYSTAV